MKKRIIALALCLALTATAFSACSSGGADKEESSSPSTEESTPASDDSGAGDSKPESGDGGLDAENGDIDLSEPMTITVTRRGNVRDVSQENLFAEVIKEKFNLDLEVTDINSDDYVTKMNLLFASGEATDLSLAHRPTFMLNDWTEAGYLRPFSLEEIQEKIPNYIAHYTPEAWDVVWQNITHSDGNTYYLPGKRTQNMNMAWMYRSDIFEEYGIEFPQTADELIEALSILKDKTGKIPVVSANGDPVWSFSGYFQIFGMPELAGSDISYVNPKTDEFVPYTFTTDNFRRLLKFLNEMYEKDLIWKEFATGTEEQVNKLISQGNGFLIWGYPEKVETDYLPLSQSENPNASWDWGKNMITEDAENGFFFKHDPYFAADGVGFSSDAEDEKVERFIYMLNWMYSDEGRVFSTYGIEGNTYEKEGENYVFTEKMANPVKPEGLQMESFGWLGNSGAYSFIPHHDNQNEYYRPYIKELEDTFIGRDNYYFFTKPIQKFTEEESSELADLETNLKNLYLEYMSKFIVGQLDIENDAEWDKYLEDMNKLGLERVEEIRTDSYNRSK